MYNFYSVEQEDNSLFLFETTIQAFKDGKRQNAMTPWNNGNTLKYSAPPKMSRKPRKHATGKIRTRWLNRNHRFNTMDTQVSGLNKIDIVAPTLRKVCNGFGPSCSYCKQDTQHPLPQNSDWSSEAWNGNIANAKEQNKSLIDLTDPKPKWTQDRPWT